MYNVVNTQAPTFSIGSSSFLQITRTTIKSRTSSKFHQIRSWTAELAWMSSTFGKFATELRPLIDVKIKFLLNILKTN